MGIVILNKQNEFRVFGRVKNVDFDYKRKGDTETIPVLELELEVPYNGAPDVVKVTAFYDKAERAAEEVEAGTYCSQRKVTAPICRQAAGTRAHSNRTG